MRARARRAAGERGAALVEFGLSVLLVTLLVLWIFEVLMAVYAYSVVADSAKEAVRYAMVHHGGSSSGGTSTCSAAGDTVSSKACEYLRQSLHNVNAASVTVSYPDTTKTAGSRVNVTISYNLLPFVSSPLGSTTLHGAASGRIIY